MSVPEIINEYESDDDELRKHEGCDYCPFDKLIRGKYRKAGILREPIPDEDHPHRLIIEEVCGKNIETPCAMKYAMERTPMFDYLVAQSQSMSTFAFDLGKYLKRTVSENEAIDLWTEEFPFLVSMNGTMGSSFANRWEEIWNLSLCSNGKHSLTEIGMYRIMFSKTNEEYLGWVKQFQGLVPAEKRRHVSGINLEEITLED